jgi:hypothetical protein
MTYIPFPEMILAIGYSTLGSYDGDSVHWYSHFSKA